MALAQSLERAASKSHSEGRWRPIRKEWRISPIKVFAVIWKVTVPLAAPMAQAHDA